MHFGAVTTVGLKGTLGHRSVLIRDSLPYGQVLSIADQAERIRPRDPQHPHAFAGVAHLLHLSLSYAVAQACGGSRTCAPLPTLSFAGSLRRRNTHREDSLRIAPLPLYSSLHFCCHATAEQRRPI
jgi:hypothetical protein